MSKSQRYLFIFSLVVGSCLLFNFSKAYACTPINKLEKIVNKQDKVDKCFSGEHKLKNLLDSVEFGIKSKNFLLAGMDASNIADYLNGLAKNKIKYATSNFPTVSSNFFYNVAFECFRKHYHNNKDTMSILDFVKWDVVIKADNGILATEDKMIKSEIEAILNAVTYLMKGVNSLESSLIIILETTKDKTDIFKPL